MPVLTGTSRTENNVCSPIFAIFALKYSCIPFFSWYHQLTCFIFISNTLPLHSASSRVTTQTRCVRLSLGRTLQTRGDVLGGQACRAWCQRNCSKCSWSECCTQRGCRDRCDVPRHRVGSQCSLVQLRSVDGDTDFFDCLLHWSHHHLDRVGVITLAPNVFDFKG